LLDNVCFYAESVFMPDTAKNEVLKLSIRQKCAASLQLMLQVTRVEQVTRT